MTSEDDEQLIPNPWYGDGTSSASRPGPDETVAETDAPSLGPGAVPAVLPAEEVTAVHYSDGAARAHSETSEQARIPYDGPPTIVSLPSDADGQDPEKKRGSFFKELPLLILIGIVIVILLKSFVVQAFFIPSGSMQNTLLINDRVLVNRLAYLYGEPERGDVIVFRNWDEVGEDAPSPSIWEFITRSLQEGVGFGGGPDDLIKRIVAVPGDTLEVRDSRVFINGEALDEPYVFVNGVDSLANTGPFVVPEGKYFVMGDHRNNSQDSRRDLENGTFVDRDAIIGQAFVKIWPLSHVGGLDVPGPLGQDGQ